MPSSIIIIKQQARNPIWLRALLSILVPSAALFFVPAGAAQFPLILLGLIAASFLLVTMTMGLKSRVLTGADGSKTLAVYDSHSRSWGYLPTEHVQSVQVINDARNSEDIDQQIENPEYHRRFKVLAYRGPALLVHYRLPPPLSSDDVMRSWLIPGPKAAAFEEALK